MIFTASLPPANTAGVLAALQVLQREPDRRDHLWANTRRLHEGFRSLGLDIGPTETPIVPVVFQDEIELCRLCKALLEEGIYINPVLRPAAAQNLLRISCTAAHTEAHVDRLVAP